MVKKGHKRRCTFEHVVFYVVVVDVVVVFNIDDIVVVVVDVKVHFFYSQLDMKLFDSI